MLVGPCVTDTSHMDPGYLSSKTVSLSIHMLVEDRYGLLGNTLHLVTWLCGAAQAINWERIGAKWAGPAT